jgi:hypothetical protein
MSSSGGDLSSNLLHVLFDVANKGGYRDGEFYFIGK